MTTSNLLLQYTAFTGIGALLACVLWIGTSTAQTSAREDEIDPPITSAPAEIPQEDGEIDYENAQPIPMPSLPDPAPLENLPVPPATGGRLEHPGSSPGSTGTGEENPQVLTPPRPPAELDPANDTSSADKKCKNLF